jgi:hypothetical protein
MMLKVGAGRAITAAMPKRQKSAPEASPSTPAARAEEGGRFHISRYHTTRNFALYEGNGLVAVTVYKKGAEAVQERLESDAQTIEDLQRQVAELTARFREQATAIPQPSLTEHFNIQTWRPPRQLPLIAEDLTAYRITPRAGPCHTSRP